MTGKTLPVTGNSINEIPKTLRKITGRLTRSSPAGVLFCIYTDISTEFNLYVNCSCKFCFAFCLFLFPFQQLILELRELLTTQTSNLVSLQTLHALEQGTELLLLKAVKDPDHMLKARGAASAHSFQRNSQNVLLPCRTTSEWNLH